MVRKIFLGVIFTTCSICSFAAMHTGHVFVDSNGNNQYDKGEKVLSGVSVSDGLNVVQTNKDGVYDLMGHQDERFIFITLPSGYRTNTYYQRLKNDQSHYDFGLQQANSKSIKSDGSHRFIHISDTHMHDAGLTATTGHAASTKNIRDYVENEDIAFVVHTGDITREGFASYKKLMNNENMPTSQMFYVVGNHDLGNGKYGEESYENHFGPAYYSFDVGNVHYIVTPMPSGDGKPDFTQARIGQWLKNDLKYLPEGKPIVSLTHSVMTANGRFKFGSNETGFVDLADYNLKAWLYGHWHHHRMYKHDGSDVLMICSPGQAHGTYNHSPATFRVLTAGHDGQLSSEIRYPYFDKSVTIASIDNGRSAVTQEGTVPLYVNAYSSASPVKKVSYSYYHQGKKYLADSPLKQHTDFSWSTEIPIPASLDGQIVTVKVTATFANGEVSNESTSFRYQRNNHTSVKAGDDWANLLQNSAHVPALKDTLQLPLQLAWVQNIGSNILFSSPIVYQGSVYAASLDDNDQKKASVMCMDISNGQIKWQYSLRHSVRSSIAASDNRILAQDVNGWLYAIDATSGQLVWEKNLEMNKQTPLDNGIVTANGVVYAGTGSTMSALQAKTGQLIWKNKDWTTTHGTPSTFSVHNGVLVAQTFWEAAYANDALTGQKLWGRGAYGYGGPATMHGDLAYFTSNNSLCVAHAKTGKRVIQKKYDFPLTSLSAPLVTNQEIILGTPADGVVAIDSETLEVKWRFKTGRSLILTAPSMDDPVSSVEGSPVLSGDIVYIGASDGVLYALDRKTGVLLWKHEVGTPILSTVAVSGNALFVSDFSGNIYAFASK